VSQPAADRSTWIEDRGPHPALRGIVVRSTGFAQRAPGPVRMRELPCTYVPVILDLGEGWRIRDARRPDAPAERRGSLGARRLLGVPMDELANRVVPLEDVLGAGGRALVDRLADAPGWEARFHLLDRALIARLGAASPAGGEVAWALGRLAAGGGVAVGDLARELGWSHRRLIARFRDEVGMAPKRVARILRFERLTALVEADPSIGWARAAAACGYFDQAHLAREVRELAGLTPTALRTERVNSVQDGAPAAA
jgi:AraC-like DNA-binding protein